MIQKSSIILLLSFTLALFSCSKDEAKYQPKSTTEDLELAYDAGTISYTIESFDTYVAKAEIIDEDASWIAIERELYVEGCPTHTIAVAENYTGEKREAHIAFVSAKGDDCLLTVVQTPYGAVHTSEEIKLTCGASSQDIELPQFHLKVAGITGSATWARIDKKSGQDKTCTLIVTANNGPAPRDAEFVITSLSGDSHTVLVHQDGKPVADTDNPNGEVSDNPAYAKPVK